MRKGRRKRSIKSHVFYPVGVLWPVIYIRRKAATKVSCLQPLGLVCQWASWPLSTSSGQDISHWEEFAICCRKADPFQGPRVVFYLTLRNEFSEKTQVLTKQENLLRRGNWVDRSRMREHSRTLCHMTLSLVFYGDRVRFWLSLANPSDPGPFPVARTSFS